MTRKKTGKNRLDKFYHLAKEQGYRCRAAFKLIHLNNKYNFLKDVDSVLDLCAAPGGWLQVASNHGIQTVIGIDIEPIKPINNVTTLKCDITTELCKKEIIRILGDKKVDLVLHDGAPNVGTAWEQDAYAQNELVLHSLKLGSEFLKEGGGFLTKVFRSKDYSALLSVFNELFEEVDATKPISSRNESAEIFVYCSKFCAEKVRNDLFDPEKVFCEVKEETLFNKIKEISLTDFINSSNPFSDLTSFEKVNYKNEEKELNGILTEEIKNSFSDLKLVNENEKRKLVRWRKKVIKMAENKEINFKISFERMNEQEIKEPRKITDEEKLEKIEEEIKKIEKKEQKKEKEKKGKEAFATAFFL